MNKFLSNFNKNYEQTKKKTDDEKLGNLGIWNEKKFKYFKNVQKRGILTRKILDCFGTNLYWLKVCTARTPPILLFFLWLLSELNFEKQTSISTTERIISSNSMNLNQFRKKYAVFLGANNTLMALFRRNFFEKLTVW